MEDSDEPGVSFLVTVYNKAPWLEGVCRQIAAQSGDFPREFIFVNDGSTDGSMDVVARCTADWPNLTIHHQENAGSAVATNVGIRLGANQGRQLQCGNQLLGLFIADYPELPRRLKQLACRRAASRTWKFAHRQRAETWLSSRNFFQQVRAYLPIWSSHTEFIRLCTDAFDELA